MQKDYTAEGIEEVKYEIPDEVLEQLNKEKEELIKAENIKIDKLIEQQKHLKKKPTGKQKEKGIGFSVCEGRLVEAVEQSKRSMDVFYNGSISEEKMTKTKQMVGVYAINRTELLGVKELFDGIQDSVINLKHRQARDICLTQLKLLESLTISSYTGEEDLNDEQILLFVRSFIDWLSAMHNIMMDQSSYTLRRRHYETFISKYEEYADPMLVSGLLNNTNNGVFKSGSKNNAPEVSN